MTGPRFAKVSAGPSKWRLSNFLSAARHALIFGALGGAVLVSMLFKFATLGLEPSRLTAPLPCPESASSSGDLTTVNVTELQNLVEERYQQRVRAHQGDLAVLEKRDRDIHAVRHNMHAWLRLLRLTSSSGGASGPDSDNYKQQQRIVSERTSCRELTAMGQTCVFEGLICINTSNALPPSKRPVVYVIDDRKAGAMDEVTPDRDGNVGERMPTDDWCGHRSQSADPRYYSSRHWPLRTDTVVPQQSCMDGWYRTSESVLGRDSDGGKRPKIKWIPNLALFDLDYQENTHNTHLAMDILWALDARLYQQSLDIHRRPGYRTHRAANDHDTQLLAPGTVYYMPQSREQFLSQTSHDINRLMYAITLGQDVRRLYGADDDVKTAPADADTRRYTKQTVLDSYPHLRDGGMQFHGNLVTDNDTDLVCGARLTTGFKTGFTADEPVCRHVRSTAFELYGIERPENKRLGSLFFPQPPKSILILNRHASRKLANWEEVQQQLTQRLAHLNVSVSYTSSDRMYTAEEWVRIFSSAGIVITPHGGQNMGIMFMHRFSALIEIMPVGYTEHSFNLLSEPCRVWYYEVPSLALKTNFERYNKECGEKTPHMYSPCNEYKSEDVWVTVDKLMPTVIMALERLGYDTGTWMDEVYEKEKQRAQVDSNQTIS